MTFGPLTFPTVHLNGTSSTALLDENLEALEAVNAAVRALERASPNARDYYPQGPNAFRAVQAEHQERIDKLQAVAVDLSRIVDALANPDTTR